MFGVVDIIQMVNDELYLPLVSYGSSEGLELQFLNLLGVTVRNRLNDSIQFSLLLRQDVCWQTEVCILVSVSHHIELLTS